MYISKWQQWCFLDGGITKMFWCFEVLCSFSKISITKCDFVISKNVINCFLIKWTKKGVSGAWHSNGMTSQKENAQSVTSLEPKSIRWLGRVWHRKPNRSNSYKNDGVGTSGEWANERPHARNWDSTFGAWGDRAKGIRQMKQLSKLKWWWIDLGAA